MKISLNRYLHCKLKLKKCRLSRLRCTQQARSWLVCIFFANRLAALCFPADWTAKISSAATSNWASNSKLSGWRNNGVKRVFLSQKFWLLGSCEFSDWIIGLKSPWSEKSGFERFNVALFCGLSSFSREFKSSGVMFHWHPVWGFPGHGFPSWGVLADHLIVI